MRCLKKPYRPTQPAICNHCKRKCERAGGRKKNSKKEAA